MLYLNPLKINMLKFVEKKINFFFTFFRDVGLPLRPLRINNVNFKTHLQ